MGTRLRQLCRIWAAIGFCASFGAAVAQPGAAANAGGMSIDQLIAELKKSNPALDQARQAYEAAKQAVPQVDGLPAPQFNLVEQANTGGPFNFNRKSDFFAYPSFTQPFLWPGKTALSKEIASIQADSVRSQYDALSVQLISQLRLSCYQLAALQDQLRFMDEDLQRLEQIKEISKARYANNAAAYIDFLNTQVAASSLENDRYSLDKQIRQQIEQINNLIGRPSQTPLSVAGDERLPHLPAEPLDQLIATAQKVNPAAAGADADALAASKSVLLAKKAFYPDFALTAGISTDPSLVDPRGTRMSSIGVNFSLPSWGFRKEKAGLAQAQAQYGAAADAQTSTLQQIDLGVANAYHALETALQQTRFTHDRLLPQAQMAYRLALTGYGSNGGTSFSDLLTARTNLHDTELGLLQAQNTAVQAYISLYAAIGKDPE